jgi:hypothetical protein
MAVPGRIAIVPVVGMMVAISMPMLRHVEQRRYEQVAIDVLGEVRVAQARFKADAGGYATDLNSLTSSCGEGPVTLGAERLERLRRSGYSLTLRAAEGADERGRDCGGRVLSSDYYVAVSPVDSVEAGEQAFAARSEGDVFLFVDGIAPLESDMSRLLAIRLDERDTFKIP